MSLKAPAISRDLIEHLQRVFPDRLPQTPIPTEQLSLLVGQQSVIRHLIAQHEMQSRTVLLPT